MNYRDFFTLDNKSGIKTKESYIEKNYPDVYNELKSFINNNKLTDLTFKEEVYYFINNITNKHVCLNCGSEVKFKGTVNKGYSDFCSLTCANNSGQLNNRQKNSIIKKYGVDSTNKLDFVKDKKKLSYIKKYGVDNPMKDNEIKNKHKESIVNKFGVDNVFKSDEIKDKHKKSIVNKYGVDNVFKSDEVKDKIRLTNNKKYGVDYPTQSKVVKDKLKDILLNKLLVKFPFVKEINNNNILKCHCDVCNNDYEITRVLLNERNREGYGLCTVCNKVGINQTSEIEKEVLYYIKSLVSDVVENSKQIISPLELDIYIPSHKLAIEFDGLYWHSELFKSTNYHINKTELCESEGIKLIHLFEDEWVYKKDIVKSRVKNLLGLSDNKIYARKCIVKEVSVNNGREFLDENHIQGNVNSSIKLGLYYNDELVSLMTFGKGRVIMGGKDNEYELIRFCNKLNTNVIGGADKLLKHFIKEYRPKEIISYADRRWSQGDLYEKLGFEFIHNSKPNYWYINGLVREYRFKYRKSKLINLPHYSSNLSEHDIMLLNKRYRIYDCGNKKYRLIINEEGTKKIR